MSNVEIEALEAEVIRLTAKLRTLGESEINLLPDTVRDHVGTLWLNLRSLERETDDLCHDLERRFALK